MLLRTCWQLLGAIVVLVLPVILFLGLWAGLAVLFAILLLMLGWHVAHFGQLMGWLDGPLDSPLPRGRGAWEIAFAGLHKRVRIRLGQQQSLAHTLDRFMRAFQALPDGVIAFDRFRHIEWINERAAAHFNLSAAKDRGQALTNLIRQPDFVAYLDHGQFSEPLIYRGGRVEGLTLLIQIIPYGEDQNLLVSRDISQIERMERMRRDFIANVSHELKTPLTVVAGFSEMLVDSFDHFDKSETQHYLQLICEQNARMQRLIEDLLTLSSLETGGSQPADEEVDVAPMLESVVADAKALSGGKHDITLEVTTPTKLRGCANELRSVFSNLVGNAVRYTPAGGQINIAWQANANGASLTVTDTGIGIAEQHIPRLTERFYRVDRSRSRETGGTGLGLAIVKHILTRHQGQLSVQSEVGKGSCFSAQFPLDRLWDAPPTYRA